MQRAKERCCGDRRPTWKGEAASGSGFTLAWPTMVHVVKHRRSHVSEQGKIAASMPCGEVDVRLCSWQRGGELGQRKELE